MQTLSNYSTSERGLADLKVEEGDVLKAYRDIAGVWTIGPGLTAASGVVKPHAGMVITAAESDRLTRLALARNYEPRVRKAVAKGIVPHNQAAFDGAVHFDWNTGRIHNATWVKLFNAGKLTEAEASLKTWNKAGGRVVAGLQNRRRREADKIFRGKYHSDAKATLSAKPGAWAVFVVAVDDAQKGAVREELEKLGYAVGPHKGEIAADAVRSFQRDRDLTVDGKIGRATLSALQRDIDARAKAKAQTATAAGGGALAGGSDVAPDAVSTVIDPALAGQIGVIVAAAGIAVLAILAYRYRDVVATRVQRRLPRLAAWLRSF